MLHELFHIIVSITQLNEFFLAYFEVKQLLFIDRYLYFLNSPARLITL